MSHARRSPALSLGLAATLLAPVQLACQPDAPSQSQAETDHAQEADAGGAHWSYEGETGADRWGALNPSFAACDAGVQQSPINLTEAIPADGEPVAIHWRAFSGRVVDNGHTIQVDVDEGSSPDDASYIELEGRRFSLLQFHFHLPSEHTLEGESYPMEVHFVHQAEEGDLAVVGVFMDQGEAHSALQEVWDAIPGANETPGALTGFDPNLLLPEGRGQFRYAGSLTTPPCSEVVSWTVMAETISVSQAQVDAFAALHPMNARPVQPLHRRFVLMR